MVGKVSNTMEIDFGRDTGYGFNITDESGRPLASLVPPGMWLEFARPDLQRREAI